jgi:hypothetical protein
VPARSASDHGESSAPSLPYALTVLSLPNMFAARAGHGIGRFLLRQLLFADWAGFSHHVRHSLYLPPRLSRPCSDTLHLAYQSTWCLSHRPAQNCSCPGRSLGKLHARVRLCQHPIGCGFIGLAGETMRPAENSFRALAGREIGEAGIGFFPGWDQVSSLPPVREIQPLL